MTSYQVILVLYDFKFLNKLPLRLTHTEVVVHGKSFRFDDECGITVMDRESLHEVNNYNYKIKKVIPLGVTFKTENDLKRLVQEINGDWSKATFRLFNHNCRHFSKRLIEELQPSDSKAGLEILRQQISCCESFGAVLITIISTNIIFTHIFMTTNLVFYFRREFKTFGRLIKHLWNELCTVRSLQIIKW